MYLILFVVIVGSFIVVVAVDDVSSLWNTIPDHLQQYWEVIPWLHVACLCVAARAVSVWRIHQSGWTQVLLNNVAA